MDGLADEPENGWPWQLQLARVFEEGKDKAGKKWYRVQCTECGLGPIKTTLTRWKDHYGKRACIGVAYHVPCAGGKKGRGIEICGVRLPKLREDHPEFMSKLAEASSKAELKCSLKKGAGTLSGTSTSVIDLTTSVMDPSKDTESSNMIQSPMPWHLLKKDQQKTLKDECHAAWALFFYANSIPFRVIESPEFKRAISLTKQVPTYFPVTRDTLSGALWCMLCFALHSRRQAIERSVA